MLCRTTFNMNCLKTTFAGVYYTVQILAYGLNLPLKTKG